MGVTALSGADAEALYVLVFGFGVLIASAVWFRLHPFFSLLLASTVVAMMTPRGVVERFFVRQQSWDKVWINESSNTVLGIPPGHVPSRGTRLQVARILERQMVSIGELEVIGTKQGWTSAEPVGKFSLREFQELTAQSVFVLPIDALPMIARQRDRPASTRLADAFGKSFADWGVLIALACLIAKFLEESTAAEKIARFCLRVVADVRAVPGSGAWTLLLFGFVFAVPLGYVATMLALSAVARAMWSRSESSFLKYMLFLHVGAWSAPSLSLPFSELPPGTSRFAFLTLGLVVGALAAAVGGVVVELLSRDYLQHRERADVVNDLKDSHTIHDSCLPPLLMALLPLLVPAVVITVGTLASGQIFGAKVPEQLRFFCRSVASLPVALMIGVFVALVLTPSYRKTTWRKTVEKMNAALKAAGPLVLTAVAAGAFSQLVRQTDIGLKSLRLQSDSLPLGAAANFFGATILETITSAGVATIESTAGWAVRSQQVPAVLLVLAALAGTRFMLWFNDPEFWIATQSSSMSEIEGIRYVSVVTAILGFTMFLVACGGCLIITWFQP